jgi:hypothetical protein
MFLLKRKERRQEPDREINTLPHANVERRSDQPATPRESKRPLEAYELEIARYMAASRRAF